MAVKFESAEVDIIVGTYVASIDEDYDARTKIVEELAKAFDVPVASIRGKLVAEKVYKKKEIAVKTANPRVDKVALGKAFESAFGMKIPSITNMTGKDMQAFWDRFVEMSAIKDASEGKV